MKKTTGLGIRIDQQEQTIAAVSRSDGHTWMVEDLSNAREGSPPPRDLAQLMARNPQAVTWLLPNDLAKASVINLPPLKGREQSRAVAGWVARSEESTPDAFTMAWRRVGRARKKSEAPQQQVFVLYARKKEIEDQLAGELAATVQPGRMLPGFMILDQFYRMTHRQESGGEAWNLVFLGKHENFLVVSRDDCLLLARGLPFDMSEGTDSDKYVERLATEIDRSGFYIRQGEHSPSIAKIVVAGDPDLADRLVKNLQGYSSTPAETWTIGEHFTWGERAIPSESYIPLMAAALSLEKPAYNLLPEPGRGFFGPAFRRRALVAVGALGIGLLPVLLVGSTLTARVQEGYLIKAKQRLETAREEAAEAAEIYKQQRLLLSRRDYIQSFHRQRPDLESVLLRIGALAPAEIRFRNLEINEDDLGKTRLTLTGESRAPTSGAAQAAFLTFQKALEKVDFLETYTEPIKLEISGEDQDRGESPRTLFKLKYILVTDHAEEG